jgi:hypothetical protein
MPRTWIAAIVLAVAALVSSAAAPAAGRTAATSKTVATVTTPGLRAVVSATKSSSGSAPTAAVTVTAYVDGKRVAERRVAGEFFWKTVTAPHGVCRLELEAAGPGKAARAQVTVQLLVSPSIGCGRSQTFALPAS